MHKIPLHKTVHTLFLATILFFTLWIVTKPLEASENDSYTRRFEPLPDQTDFLNQKVNEFLEKAVDKANLQTRKKSLLKNNSIEPKMGTDCCNSEILYNQIRFQLARPLIGQLESFVNELPKEKSRKVSFEGSIYKGFTLLETPTLTGVKKMGSLVRIKNSVIGADKFGHFFSEGWSYFSVAYSDEIHFEAALLFGEISESVFFGALTTGVYSFADLAANFNGMRFWNRVLGDNPDVLDSKKKPAPYIRCINNQWKIIKKFDWRDYIDAAWDEGTNCSSFRNDTLLKKVSLQIDLLGQAENRDCTCPLERKKINRLRKKYGVYSDHLLNPNGHTVLAENLQPQVLLDKFWNNRKQNLKQKWEINVFNLIEKQLKEFQKNKNYKKYFRQILEKNKIIKPLKEY